MLIEFRDVAIEIEDSVIILLKHFVQRNGNPESGGILLGKYSPSERKYLITEATKPNVFDKSGLSFFIRKAKPAQRIIDTRWRTSAGTINYLGEWHTHDCNNPTPSSTDLALIRSIIFDQSNVWPEVIMIIVGHNFWYIGVAKDDGTEIEIESEQIEVK